MKTLFIALLAAGLACAEETKWMNSKSLNVEFKVPAAWPRLRPRTGPFVLQAEDGSTMAVIHAPQNGLSTKEMFENFESTFKAKHPDYERLGVAYATRVEKDDCLEITYTYDMPRGRFATVLWMFNQPDALWCLEIKCPVKSFEAKKELFGELIDAFRPLDQGHETPDRSLATLLKSMRNGDADTFLRSFDPDRCGEYGNEDVYATRIRLEKVSEGWLVVEMCDANETETK
jgi:hypothetical protein